jgi:hypothetical protein
LIRSHAHSTNLGSGTSRAGSHRDQGVVVSLTVGFDDVPNPIARFDPITS